MYITDTALSAGVDAIAGLFDFLSVHTAFSTTGANEDSGGSYGRTAAAWNSGSGGEATLNGNVDINVNAITAKYVGGWSLSSGGTFYGMFPVGSTGFKKFYAIASTDVFHAEAHGFANDARVVLFGDALPGGVTQATEYWVVNTATDTFQLSTSQGGGAVDVTDEGFGVASILVAETFSSPGVLRVNGTTSKLSLLGLRT